MTVGEGQVVECCACIREGDRVRAGLVDRDRGRLEPEIERLDRDRAENPRAPARLGAKGSGRRGDWRLTGGRTERPPRLRRGCTGRCGERKGDDE